MIHCHTKLEQFSVVFSINCNKSVILKGSILC